MLEGHGGLVGKGQDERLLVGREVVDVAAQHGEGADGVVADEERRRQHGSEAPARRELTVAHARVAVEVGALDRAQLGHGGAGDPVPDLVPDADLREI